MLKKAEETSEQSGGEAARLDRRAGFPACIKTAPSRGSLSRANEFAQTPVARPDRPRMPSEIPSPLLLDLQRLEQRLEVPLAEALAPAAGDDLKEKRRAVLQAW